MCKEKTQEELKKEVNKIVNEPDRARAELTYQQILAIRKFNKQTLRYSRILIWLTGIMTVAVLIQIVIMMVLYKCE